MDLFEWAVRESVIDIGKALDSYASDLPKEELHHGGDELVIYGTQVPNYDPYKHWKKKGKDENDA